MAGRPEYYGLGEDIAALKEQATKLKAALDALDGRTKTLEGKPAPEVTKADLEKLAKANTDALAALKKDATMRGPKGDKGDTGPAIEVQGVDTLPADADAKPGVLYITKDGKLHTWEA